MTIFPRPLPLALGVLGALGCASGSPEGSADPCLPGSTLVGNECLPDDQTDDGGSDSSGGASSSGADGSSESGETGGSGSSGDAGSSGDESSTGTAPPVAIDLHDVIIHDNPANVADWPISCTITRLEFRADGVYVEFAKKDGDGRWPDITPPGWDGPLQYTLGFVELIDGQWHGSAAMQYWYGLDVQGGNVAIDNQVAINWYYDGRWGEMAGYQPALGETIGVFVVAGNLRGVTDGSQSPVQERTDVVVVPFPGADGAVHDF